MKKHAFLTSTAVLAVALLGASQAHARVNTDSSGPLVAAEQLGNESVTANLMPDLLISPALGQEAMLSHVSHASHGSHGSHASHSSHTSGSFS
jgi:hypothetical protein